MEKLNRQNKPICKWCNYMSLEGYAQATLKNNYNPRGSCYCKHPEAEKNFKKLFPKSPKMPTFIAYTKMGGKLPQIKTCPKWCPLKEETWEGK